MDEIFNKTLSNFVKDFACKDEIVSKFKNKKTISRIRKELLYKINEDSIIDIIWKCLIENNIILLYDIDDSKNYQYDIVKKIDRFGKTYFEKIKIKTIDSNEYIKVNIKNIINNKNIYDNLDDFYKEIFTKLPFENRDYYVKGIIKEGIK